MKIKIREMKGRLLLLLALLLMMPIGIFAQSITVKGTVLDSQGEPIIGATVKEKNRNAGVITDLNGGFSLNVSGKSAKLEISYIGITTALMPI